jgi:thymidylate kinase
MIANLDWAGSYDTIVFEGCDGTGKTTLAEATAQNINASLIHSTLTPPGTDLVTTYHCLLEPAGRLVFDRCFLSELVYGPLYRGHTRLTYQHMATLVRHVVARNGIFVHVTAPANVIRQRLVARGERHLPDLDEIELVCDRYDELFRAVRTMAKVLLITTDHPDEDT